MTATPLQAHRWERAARDWYVEERWCTAALLAAHRFDGPIHDPCCGQGNVVEAACAAGYAATGSDIERRWPPRHEFSRYIKANVYQLPPNWRWANVITNPPFSDMKAVPSPLVTKLLGHAADQLALLLPATWHCGAARSAWLETTPLASVLFLTPRPSMPPGEALLRGEKRGGGTTDFAWFVWHHGHEGPASLGWARRPS